MTRYSVSFNRIIDADSEEEAIDQFWVEADGAMKDDAECFVYNDMDDWSD